MIDQLGSDSKSTGQAHGSHASLPNYYELLDVPTYATRLQIREAYIRLKNTYASGSQALYSLVSDEEARTTIDKIEEAYRVLDDELLRKEYDDKQGIQRDSMQRSGFGDGYGSGQQGELVQIQARRTLNPRDEFDDSYDDSLWNVYGGAEAPRPISRVTTTFTKIKKFATHAFDQEVQDKISAITTNLKHFDGKGLVQLREIVGIAQSEMQERTKISIEYIKALENNDFQKLPSLVYVRGFLKIYLQYLGIQDGKGLIEAYTEKYNLWRETHKSHSS